MSYEPDADVLAAVTLKIASAYITMSDALERDDGEAYRKLLRAIEHHAPAEAVADAIRDYADIVSCRGYSQAMREMLVVIKRRRDEAFFAPPARQ